MTYYNIEILIIRIFFISSRNNINIFKGMLKSIIKSNSDRKKTSNKSKNVTFRKFLRDMWIYSEQCVEEKEFIIENTEVEGKNVSSFIDECKLEDIEEIALNELSVLDDPYIKETIRRFRIPLNFLKKVLALTCHMDANDKKFSLSIENTTNIVNQLKANSMMSLKEIEFTLCMVLKHHLVNYYNTIENTTLLHSVENKILEILKCPLKFSTRMLIFIILIFLCGHPTTERFFTFKNENLKKQLLYNIIMLHYVPDEKIVISDDISNYEEYEFRLMTINFVDYFRSGVRYEDLNWSEYSSNSFLCFFEDTVKEFVKLINILIKSSNNNINCSAKNKSLELGIIINYTIPYLSFLTDNGFFKREMSNEIAFEVLQDIARTTEAVFTDEKNKEIITKNTLCYRLKKVFVTLSSFGISLCRTVLKYPNCKNFLNQSKCWFKVITFLYDIEDIENENVISDEIKEYHQIIRQNNEYCKTLYKKYVKKIKKMDI
uniref:Zinc finger protein n=1 Tax=Strongyloides stercoralis TaxID=6248 RepID=A0A0K0DTP6_STRER